MGPLAWAVSQGNSTPWPVPLPTPGGREACRSPSTAKELPQHFPDALVAVIWEFLFSSNSEKAAAGESYSHGNSPICPAHPRTSRDLVGGWEGQPKNQVSHAYVGLRWPTGSALSAMVLSLKLKDPHSWVNWDRWSPWLSDSCSKVTGFSAGCYITRCWPVCHQFGQNAPRLSSSLRLRVSLGPGTNSNQLRPVNLARSEGLVLVLLNPVLKATRGTQGFLQLWGPQRVWIPSCDGGHI